MKSLLCVLALLGLASAVPWEVTTALDTYVNAAEPAYGYQVLSTDNTQPGVTVHFLNLTSLTWFDETLTTEPTWWHYLTVVIPNNVVYDDSFLLYVSSGDNTDGVPDVNSGGVRDMINFANNTGAVTSLLNQIPNQPLFFTDEDNGTRPRSEDAIIGYTWKLFIEETVDDPDVILLFPMAKAAKQAVDTVIEYVASVNPAIQLTQVMPTGFSKRGWTTWLLGCVDQRVFAMAPVVFDLLNFYENLQHHYTSLGGWSWAFTSYYAADIPRYLHHDRTRAIGGHIDPLEYNARLTMPKLLTGGSGDQFFLPDGTHFWWYEITGAGTTDNHYTLFENDDHGLGAHRAPMWQNIEGFFISARDGLALPDYSVTKSEDATAGAITVTTVTPPTWVKAWTAQNSNRTCEPNDTTTGTCRRDFRLARWDLPSDTLIEWTAEDLVDLGSGVYSVSRDKRTDFGQTIFHVEMGYPGPGGREFRFTTESHIIPDTFPFDICIEPDECQGSLK